MTRIGIDFDNTVACYDAAFFELALERGLIPRSLPPHKEHVRDYLRELGQEDAWTELQGIVYGARMDLARPFPGVREFLQLAVASGTEVILISHKTRFPYLGERYDLHAAARSFLSASDLVDAGPGSLAWNQVIFEETLAGKLRRIKSARCDVFVDDLPELLRHPDFPSETERVLFDPHLRYELCTDLRSLATWDAIATALLSQKA